MLRLKVSTGQNSSSFQSATKQSLLIPFIYREGQRERQTDRQREEANFAVRRLGE